MTKQDLTNNKQEIIAEIKTNYPSANVLEFMTAMVNMLPMCESDDALDYVNEVGDLMFEEKTTNEASEWLAAKNRENAIGCSSSLI